MSSLFERGVIVRREAVNTVHHVAQCQEAARKVEANESGRAGDQEPHLCLEVTRTEDDCLTSSRTADGDDSRYLELVSRSGVRHCRIDHP